MKQYFVVLFLIISACLAGCGSGKSGSQSMDEGGMGENGGENPVYEENSFDWHSQNFARNDNVEEASVLGAEAFRILTLNGDEGAAENPDCFYGTDTGRRQKS